MSYVRWSRVGHPWDYDSAVYIYDDVAGGITCCGCSLVEHGFNCETVEEMVAHVQKHIDIGDDVPDFVIPRLEAGQSFN